MEKKKRRNHEIREQLLKLEENHLYWKKSQLVKENEELNLLTSVNQVGGLRCYSPHFANFLRYYLLKKLKIAPPL